VAPARDTARVVRRFRFDDGAYQRRIEIVGVRRFLNDGFVRLARRNGLEIVDGHGDARLRCSEMETAGLHLRRHRQGERAEKEIAHPLLAALRAAAIVGMAIVGASFVMAPVAMMAKPNGGPIGEREPEGALRH